MTARAVRQDGRWLEPGRPARAVALAGNGANRIGAAMKEEPPKQLRVRTVGTKLTDREYAQCEKSAARRGQTNGASGGSSCMRPADAQVLLAAVESPLKDRTARRSSVRSSRSARS